MKTIKTTLKTALDSIHCLNRFNTRIDSIQWLSWLEYRVLPIRLIVLISYICSSAYEHMFIGLRTYVYRLMNLCSFKCPHNCTRGHNFDVAIFPHWEQNIPTLGTKHSQAGNKTGLRLACDEISLTAGQSVASRTSRASRDFSDLWSECGDAIVSCLTRFLRPLDGVWRCNRLVVTLLLALFLGVSSVKAQDYSGVYYTTEIIPQILIGTIT